MSSTDFFSAASESLSPISLARSRGDKEREHGVVD
jgi:hypothetical protein